MDTVKHALKSTWDVSTKWRYKVADTSQQLTEETIPQQKYFNRRMIAKIVRYLALAFLFFGYYFFKKTRYLVWAITIIMFIASYFEKN